MDNFDSHVFIKFILVEMEIMLIRGELFARSFAIITSNVKSSQILLYKEQLFIPILHLQNSKIQRS